MTGHYNIILKMAAMHASLCISYIDDIVISCVVHFTQIAWLTIYTDGSFLYVLINTIVLVPTSKTKLWCI